MSLELEFSPIYWCLVAGMSDFWVRIIRFRKSSESSKKKHSLSFCKSQLLCRFNLVHTKKLIQSVRFDSDLKGMKIMVGGLVINESEDLWKILGADGTASSAVEAVEMAKCWWEERE
jgi:methanogenic corrinoid protein MtbC1